MVGLNDLTDKVITKLQTFFGKAINDNKGQITKAATNFALKLAGVFWRIKSLPEKELCSHLFDDLCKDELMSDCVEGLT